MAAALTAAAVTGWAKSTILAPSPVDVENPRQIEVVPGGGGHYELPPLW